MSPLVFPAAAAVIVFQIFLSKRPSRWMKLILPAVWVLFSVIVCIWFVLSVTAQIKEPYLVSTSDDQTYSFATEAEAAEFMDTRPKQNIESYTHITQKTIYPSGLMLGTAILFLGLNIVTLILLLISRHYRTFRESRMKHELISMQVQDLE